MMARNTKNLQTDLQFLLKNGWRLIDFNTIENPDGTLRTTRIRGAAEGLRKKLALRKELDEHASQKFLLKPVLKPSLLRKFWQWWWWGEKF